MDRPDDKTRIGRLDVLLSTNFEDVVITRSTDLQTGLQHTAVSFLFYHFFEPRWGIYGAFRQTC